LPELSNIAIQTVDLFIGYQKLNPVLSSLNLSFEKGQIIGLVAKNGTGKSTLIKTLCGALPVHSGSIFINGKNAQDFTKKELAKNIALVLTEKPNLSGLKVKDLVGMGRYPHTGFLGKLDRIDITIIENSIELCNIRNLKEKYCNELSDGEFQKVMLARAIAQQTSLLLLDEPTAFLDFPSKLNLMKLLNDLSRKQNTCIIIASHDLELLIEYSQKLLILKNNDSHDVIDAKSTSIIELVDRLES